MLTKFIYSRISMYFFILLVALIVILMLNFNTIKNKNRQIRDFKQIVKSEAFEGRAWKDDAGAWRHRTEVTALENQSSMINAIHTDKKLNELVESVAGIKSSMRNLKSVSITGTHTTIERLIPIHDTVIITIGNDTLKAKKFYYNDKYTKISGVILKDTLYPKFENRDTIFSSTFWKRRWFFGRKHYMQELRSSNPNTKIEYSKSVVVLKR